MIHSGGGLSIRLSIGEDVEIDLVAHLQRVAAVDEDDGAVGKDDRHAGRAGEAGQPVQPLGAGGDIFALMLVGARHDEAVEFFAASHSRNRATRPAERLSLSVSKVWNILGVLLASEIRPNLSGGRCALQRDRLGPTGSLGPEPCRNRWLACSSRLFDRARQCLYFVAWRSRDFVSKENDHDHRARTDFSAAAFDAFIAARQRQADRYVNNVLLSLDDETLKAHGYSRAELRKRPGSAYFF